MEKNVEQKQKKKKNQVNITVKYNDDTPIDLLLDKKQRISDLINEMKLDPENDYDFYDDCGNIFCSLFQCMFLLFNQK